MNELTLTDLAKIIRKCAGDDEDIDFQGDILDAEFAALGYDSLSLLETTGHIQREYGVHLADDVTNTAKTPRELLGLVNKAIHESE